jgi:hypothetical protein
MASRALSSIQRYKQNRVALSVAQLYFGLKSAMRMSEYIVKSPDNQQSSCNRESDDCDTDEDDSQTSFHMVPLTSMERVPYTVVLQNERSNN